MDKKRANCGSAEVYSSKGGLSAVAFGRVNGLKLCPNPMTVPTPDQYSEPVTARVCADCGWLGLFSEDQGFLARIKDDPTWERVGA
jgi:hypothetical protein